MIVRPDYLDRVDFNKVLHCKKHKECIAFQKALVEFTTTHYDDSWKKKHE